MPNKHLLISGGAGFIGTQVARAALDDGHGVTVLDSLSPQIHGPEAAYVPPAGVTFIRGDITNRDDWKAALAGIDSVVHLAAETGTGQSMYEIDRYYRVNVQGTAILFDILANGRHGVGNVVLASSRSVYGEGAYLCRSCDDKGLRCFPEPRPKEQLEAHDWAPRCPACEAEIEPVATREDDKLSPASIYAATKLAQEELVGVACRSMGIAYSILRLQNVYGEGQSLTNPYTGILSIFSTRIRSGLPIELFEDGEESRDFVHVDDVAAAMLKFIESPTPDGIIVNVGRGIPVTIFELAHTLCRIMGSDIQPKASGRYRIGDIRHNFADLSRLEAVTGWSPQVPLEAGMKRFCQWAASQPLSEDLLEGANAELQSRKLMG